MLPDPNINRRLEVSFANLSCSSKRISLQRGHIRYRKDRSCGTIKKMSSEPNRRLSKDLISFPRVSIRKIAVTSTRHWRTESDSVS